MATEFRPGYCKACECARKLERRGTNHILHLLMTIVTFGVWLIVWFGVSVKFGGWSCAACGSKKVSTSIPRGANRPS